MPNLNVPNRTLFHGDNLPFLRGINSESIHLIATDPPFNKNKDFHATPDSLAKGSGFQDRWSWRDDIHDDWLDSIQHDYPEVWQIIQSAKHSYGYDMAAFLCFMAVRLLEMHRILREDGSLFLHCDHTASHYLKLLLDAIFGTRNFRSEITWKRTVSHNDSRRNYGALSDSIFFYSKGEVYTFQPQYVPYSEEHINRIYKFVDENGRRYSTSNIRSPSPRPNLTYDYKGYKPHPNGWTISLERMQQLDEEGRLLFPKNKDGRIRLKLYLDEMPGVPVGNIWDDIPPISSQAKERLGYPTQKPLALYERIIQSSSNPGDVVLDPFCGCATTPVAAERLGRQWIGMDLWNETHAIILKRLQDEGLAGPDGSSDRLVNFGEITLTSLPPVRTDGGDSPAPAFDTPTGRKGPRYPAPRTQHGKLLSDIGPFCQGCGRDYGFDPRVLEVDHRMPKSDGGNDHYDNLTLLCPPCNKAKRDRLTLTGLQAENRRQGHLVPEREVNIRHGSAGRRGAGRAQRRR